MSSRLTRTGSSIFHGARRARLEFLDTSYTMLNFSRINEELSGLDFRS